MSMTLQKWLERNKKEGWTKTRLARAAGIPRPQISMYVSGRRLPKIANAMAIARATKGQVPVEIWNRQKPTRRKSA